MTARALVKAKPEPLCCFCGGRFPRLPSVAACRQAGRTAGDPVAPICTDCCAAVLRDEAFFLALLAGPDASQSRRGLPPRRAIYRLRIGIKRLCRDLGFHVRWGRVPPGLSTTDELPDCSEEDE